jgi:hypothetical protein
MDINQQRSATQEKVVKAANGWINASGVVGARCRDRRCGNGV